jgi:hypothetical protein
MKVDSLQHHVRGKNKETRPSGTKKLLSRPPFMTTYSSFDQTESLSYKSGNEDTYIQANILKNHFIDIQKTTHPPGTYRISPDLNASHNLLPGHNKLPQTKGYQNNLCRLIWIKPQHSAKTV